MDGFTASLEPARARPRPWSPCSYTRFTTQTKLELSFQGTAVMTRKYNFCAGPAALPEPVLARARDEMLDWHACGLSIMEMSHRSPEVVGVAEAAEASLRRLLSISDDYAVLFLQGGARWPGRLCEYRAVVPESNCRGASLL